MEFVEAVKENEAIEIESLLQSLKESDWEEAGVWEEKVVHIPRVIFGMISMISFLRIS